MSCSNASFMIPKLKEQGALQDILKGKETAVLPEAGILGDAVQGISTDQPHVKSGLGLCFSCQNYCVFP